MKHTKRVVAGVLLAASLVAASCGDDSKSSSTTAATTAAGGGSSTPTVADGSLKGKTVTIFSSIRAPEDGLLAQAWKPFEDRTGVTIKHTGSGEFEAQLKVQVAGGSAPDLAFIPQPGLLSSMVATGKAIERPDLLSVVKANDVAGFDIYGSVGGKFYAPPLGANIKSLVWYSPKAFTAKGYKIPTTWDEMVTLSDKIAADGGTPWCAGIGSGDATGWPLTDWLEDAVLRFEGPDVYDQWVAHTIPFNDPKIKDAATKVAAIILNPKYVKDVAAIATTTFQNGGLGILDGSCYMHRQASFYGNQFPKGTTTGPDGQVNAFYFPVAKAGDPQVMLGGGEFITAFADRPEVKAVQDYLTSAEYANARAALGNWISPNLGLKPSVITDPLNQSFATLLQTSKIFRFDGSDMMPAAVGAGAEWKEMTKWVTGKDLDSVLKDIEAAWPKS
jgi:alpha-glucoside transport system substrate-binding protein